jgi:isopenicillin-N synthase
MMIPLLICVSSFEHPASSTSNPTSPALPERVGRVGLEATVPVIDISQLLQPRRNVEDNARYRRVAEAVVAAGRNGSAGFFTVVNHGVDQSAVERIALDFFRWPMVEKMQLAPALYNANSTHRFRGYAPPTVNGKELLDSSNPAFRARPPSNISDRAYLEEPTRCVPSRPELCESLDAYWHAMQALAQRLLAAIALGLGEPDTDFFGRAMRVGEPMSCLRFNRYPVFSQAELATSTSNSHAEGLACEAHRDMTLLTLLNQGREGGLQIFQAGGWRDVPLTPGAFVVNIGGGLQRWTNDELVATEHRVRMVDAERISIPFFVEAAYDSPMDCMPATVSADSPCRYAPTTYGPYIKSTFKLFQEYSSRF